MKSPGPLLRRRPQLPLLTRVLLLVAGFVLVLVGLVGLVLPGLQGILTLILAVAVLSLVSPRLLLLLRGLFRPWPKAWRQLLRLRRRVLHWLEEKSKR